MPWVNNQKSPELKDKLVCGFSYLSLGMVGLVYYLFRGGRDASSFFLYHFYQSILLGLFMMLITWTGNALMSVVGGLLGMFTGGEGGLIWAGTALVWIRYGFLLVALYGAVFAFLGRYGDIPGIAKLARMQMRR